MKIFGRDCVVRSIGRDVADTFVSSYHSQGKVNVETFCYGLFHEDSLVGVLQLCPPRTVGKQRKYSLELVRLCFKKDVRVVGGASKLFKFFLNDRNPSDVFTYQDTTGENSDVYVKCGFSLVRQDKVKQYFLAPNKTLGTADRSKKELLSYSYAVQYGPDRILGTKLGVQYNDDGSRKTNVQLFRELGWSVVSTSGDKLFEWLNPNITYYTYKITASDSDKYYYGVSHVKKPNATVEDCLNDGYYGSGNRHRPERNKFLVWRKKHSETLVKEVLELFRFKNEAYNSEKVLVGDNWKTDPLCLNSREGGIVSNFFLSGPSNILEKECSVHGRTLHRGDSCFKCSAAKTVTVQVCEVHGETKFVSGECRKCFCQNNVALLECSIHGLSKHIGSKCYRCLGERNAVVDSCVIHGVTKFQGGKCCKCSAAEAVSTDVCEVHGETVFYRGTCRKCVNDSSITLSGCSVHGLVKHNGSSCCLCVSDGSFSVQVCGKHGDTKFIGSRCRKCVAENNISVKECSVHGMSKHIGSRCYQCMDRSKVNVRSVPMSDRKFGKKECSYCGSLFVPSTPRQKFCDNSHFTNCSSCGVEMVMSHQNPKKAARVCDKCLADGSAYSGSSVSKSCKLCGELFRPSSNRQEICGGEHFRDCVVCGNRFLWKAPYRKMCCSRKCSLQYGEYFC